MLARLVDRVECAIAEMNSTLSADNGADRSPGSTVMATSINAVAIYRMDCELKSLFVIFHDECKEFLDGPFCFSLIKISNFEPAAHVKGLNLLNVMAQSGTQTLGCTTQG
eukprot:9954529-Heterocapsa_arctica.AAC.1